ncbi:MAG: FAD-dependent oxidoreductase [Myxococcaceae bacterium]|nr:FAD-dependent oxidoreductase [Myxococcaceae bacterium]
MRALNTDMNAPTFTPGIEGFRFEDLYDPKGLRRLTERFYAEVEASDPALWAEWVTYRDSVDPLTGTSSLPPTRVSDVLLKMAAKLSPFVARLFNVGDAVEGVSRKLQRELRLFEFKREFITRRVFKKGAQDRPHAGEFPELDARMRVLFKLGFPEAYEAEDEERAVAESILTLMEIERMFAGQLPPGPDAPARAQELRERWSRLRAALVSTEEGKAAFGATLVSHGDDAAELSAVRGLLALADRWTYARALHPEASRKIKHWVTHHQPKPLAFDRLVELKQPEPETMAEALEGPDHHLRRRDGFKLTDRRGTTRQVMNEVEYCVICHERDKDSCSKGFKAKDPAQEGHTFKKNPLGIPLTGCPLDEKISEAHALKAKGDPLGALAMVMLDNPMCPGTGHRICNDCMKACIYQKQEPVNIPLAETHTLTDVLELPWGFEIYGLFTRWNPLNARRPHALPYNGKNVLVVGLGPAGYTLSHYLLNEGFAVAGIDGLKVEPFPNELTGHNGVPMRPIRDFREITSELDERVLSGFGGVSEYGITVRWDKNFLTLIHLTLARRRNFRIYGGIRFGGTLTIEDAWALGFDHIAIAAGAGRPTIIGMKNNLIRGIRKASDFLMALQLTGAFKKDSLANLQVQLPAVVIGGGLTGIDTATELMAFYPVQVEKILERHERLAAAMGEDAVFARLDAEEQAVYRTFLEHGRAVRAERARAARDGDEPDFVRLVRSWGGVSLCYRRSMVDSPAYRLNHEEIAKALEEGIRFIERVSPVEAIPDAHGAVSAVKFERMAMVDGRLKGTGEYYTLPAKTVCVAAGTSPNVTYEKEYPGTFVLDKDQEYFQGYCAVEDGEGGFRLEPCDNKKDLGTPAGFFTSYASGGRFITFYGDNHPTYAGNVVKAMASAKDGYPEVARLFWRETKPTVDDEAGQPARDAKMARFFATLDDAFLATVVAVNRLTPTIVEVVVKAKYATVHFQPGQFFRLQNFERNAPCVEGTRLTMEGLALTGAWVDKEKGLMSTIVLEMGSSSRMCAMLQPGQPVVLMGPTGAPTEIPEGETVLLAGGGLGNAVLFSIARALKAARCKVIYFAGYRKKEDVFKQDEIEDGTDQIVWSVDSGEPIAPRRPQDATFVGNIVQAMVAFAEGRLPVAPVAPLKEVDRIIAIGSDRMMAAVKAARYGVLKPHLKERHEAIGSINSPMQCMMKEICAQCLQKHVDPVTGKETVVFSCFNQDQRLDAVDFAHLNTRLKANSVVEKQSNLWLDQILKLRPELRRI